MNFARILKWSTMDVLHPGTGGFHGLVSSFIQNKDFILWHSRMIGYIKI